MSAPLFFRCPSTGIRSRTAIPTEWLSSSSALEYRAVDCPSCKRMHLINPTTGALLVDEERQRKVQRCGTRAIDQRNSRPRGGLSSQAAPAGVHRQHHALAGQLARQPDNGPKLQRGGAVALDGDAELGIGDLEVGVDAIGRAHV